MQEYIQAMYQAALDAHNAFKVLESLQEQYVLDHQAGKLSSNDLIEKQLPATKERQRIRQQYHLQAAAFMDAAEKRGVSPWSIQEIGRLANLSIDMDALAKGNRDALAQRMRQILKEA